ncbi:hypothetical protein CcaCcLH18_03409 [Colletotrichum camelliae]|nr:hypothetical protein CcaCcLH18_03409 [Colletotrichum camelliae]
MSSFLSDKNAPIPSPHELTLSGIFNNIFPSSGPQKSTTSEPVDAIPPHPPSVGDEVNAITPAPPHPPSMGDDVAAITPAPPHPPSMGDDVDAITPAPPLSLSRGSNASSGETKIADPDANKKPPLPGSSIPNDAIDSANKEKPGNTNTSGGTQSKVKTIIYVEPPNEPHMLMDSRAFTAKRPN